MKKSHFANLFGFFGYRIILFLVFVILSVGIITVLPIITSGSIQNKIISVKDSDLRKSADPSEVESTLSKEETQIKGETSVRNVYLGFWTQGFFDPKNFQLHTEVLKELEKKIGKKAAIAHYYRGWEELAKQQLVDELNSISANGWRPMVSANPYFFSQCNSNGMSLYRAIANGNCDKFMRQVGRNLKNFNKPFFLRFAWEMNIDSLEWGVARVGSSAEEFVLAWKRFHDILAGEGANNILWVFSPNVGQTVIGYKSLYPGEGYVDWLGLDGYNWGTTQPWSSWQTFRQVFLTSYNELLNVVPGKPLMIAEVNTTHEGGSKPQWYDDMLLSELAQNFPQVKAVVFYNENRSVSENVNWLIDISAESLETFRRAISQPFYLSSF